MAAEEELIMSKCSKQLNFKPARTLIQLLKETKLQISDEAFAKFLDEQDELKNLREDFWYPKMKDLPPVDLSFVDEEADSLYFCGNSLGIQAKETGVVVKEEMEKWQKMSLYGHFYGKYPWWIIEDFAVSKTTKLVGAKEIEVAIMNSLTVNLHLMLVPFYRPNPQRHKVLLEAKTFPSDHYAIQSQIRYHGYDPAESIVEVVPRKDEEILRTEDIISIIEEQGDSIALVMFSGVQYYTGQFFDIEKITAAAQKKGCVVGWDLAHAVGNVELKLHDWNVDFACWCSYKYLNGGPGAVAGAFIHERHAYNFDLPKFAGWWGQNRKKRFEMGHEFESIPGAAGFQLSNPPLLSTVALVGSLKVFEKTSMEQLRAKSLLLTAYLELLLVYHYGYSGGEDGEAPSKTLQNGICSNENVHISILTPINPSQRGCQLSVKFSVSLKAVHNELEKRGVVVDTREPDVMRIAPTPLYNSFTDVYRFVTLLGEVFNTLKLKE